MGLGAAEGRGEALAGSREVLYSLRERPGSEREPEDFRKRGGYRQTSFYCALLYCSSQILFFCFYKLKVRPSPAKRL